MSAVLSRFGDKLKNMHVQTWCGFIRLINLKLDYLGVQVCIPRRHLNDNPLSLSHSLSLCKLRILPSIVIINLKVWEHFFICSIHILVHFRCIAVVRKCFLFRHYIKERLYYESGCQKHACLVLNFQQAL